MKDSVLIKRIWEYAKPYKWAFARSYLVLVVEMIGSQMLPLSLEKVINYAVYEADLKRFFWAAGQYALVFGICAACGFVQLQFWQRIHNQYVYKIRSACYEKVLRLKPFILSDMKTGDLIRTINEDTEEFHHIIQRFAMRAVNAGIGTVIALGIVASMKKQIAVFMIIFIPVTILVSRRMELKIKKISAVLRERQGNYSAWLMEIIKGMREVRFLAAERTVQKQFVQKNHEIVRAQIKQDRLQFQVEQIVDGIYFAADILFYIICAWFVVKKSINVGEYLAINTYYSMVSWNVKRILRGKADYQMRKTCIERVFRLLDEEEEKDEKKSLLITSGNIEIRNLSFAYDEKTDIIKCMNLHIKSGEKIGIIGQSGGGKSTLASLLLKFYEPQEGEILIDGQNLKDCNADSIRKRIGIVNQETIIFETTVRENITFGMAASDERVWELLENVKLRDVIERLPKGLESIISDGSLSGGQKQRLCIARLLFREPKIMILDEATSALDKENEKIVTKVLEEFSTEKTMIVISHRYQILKNTDRVLMIKNGEATVNESFASQGEVEI